MMTMTTRRRLSLVLMLLVTTLASVVAQTRYCLSYEDFKNDKWVEMEDSVWIAERTNSQKFWSGGGNFKFTTGNEEKDEFLKKKVRFIIHENKMYVNLHNLRVKRGGKFGNHYAQAYRYAEEKVCFVAMGKPSSNKVLVGGILGGAVGGVIVASTEMDENNEVCYIMDSDEQKVKQIKAKEMSALLAESTLGPGLYETYDKAAKESAVVVIRQLKKLGLLKPY